MPGAITVVGESNGGGGANILQSFGLLQQLMQARQQSELAQKHYELDRQTFELNKQVTTNQLLMQQHQDVRSDRQLALSEEEQQARIENEKQRTNISLANYGLNERQTEDTIATNAFNRGIAKDRLGVERANLADELATRQQQRSLTAVNINEANTRLNALNKSLEDKDNQTRLLHELLVANGGIEGIDKNQQKIMAQYGVSAGLMTEVMSTLNTSKSDNFKLQTEDQKLQLAKAQLEDFKSLTPMQRSMMSLAQHPGGLQEIVDFGDPKNPKSQMAFQKAFGIIKGSKTGEGEGGPTGASAAASTPAEKAKIVGNETFDYTPTGLDLVDRALEHSKQNAKYASMTIGEINDLEGVGRESAVRFLAKAPVGVVRRSPEGLPFAEKKFWFPVKGKNKEEEPIALSDLPNQGLFHSTKVEAETYLNGRQIVDKSATAAQQLAYESFIKENFYTKDGLKNFKDNLAKVSENTFSKTHWDEITRLARYFGI